jgi:hypothetical protein
MLVQQAKAAARAWVGEEPARLPGFVGAFFSGSINEMAEDAELPATSDVDLLIVIEGRDLPPKPGKFLYRGALIEASYLSSADIRTPEQVLSTPHLAWNLRAASLILDPMGRLALLREVVVKEYARRPWVLCRCRVAHDKVLRNLAVAGEAAPWPDRAISWLFGAGVTTHILLLAGLRNPTVRKRYLAVRDLLAEYGATGFYPTLLEMLGCAHWSLDRTAQHLGTMAEVFDAASAVIQSPFAFAADIGPDARSVAVDGCRELIGRGDHREAVFWIAVTHSRCQQVLLADAPAEMHEQYLPDYMRMLADLGIVSSADLEQRVAQIGALLPAVWQQGEAIVDANSEIEGEPCSIKM